jgi:hypothetical protein
MAMQGNQSNQWQSKVECLSISYSLPNRVDILNFWQKCLKKLQFGKRLSHFWQLGKKLCPARKYTQAVHSWHRGF